MKNYRTSDKPSLAQVGRFIYTKGTPVRKPKVTIKMLLKERQKARTIQVKESRETKYESIISETLESAKNENLKLSEAQIEFLHKLIELNDKTKGDSSS